MINENFTDKFRDLLIHYPPKLNEGFHTYIDRCYLINAIEYYELMIYIGNNNYEAIYQQHQNYLTSITNKLK